MMSQDSEHHRIEVWRSTFEASGLNVIMRTLDCVSSDDYDCIAEIEA